MALAGKKKPKKIIMPSDFLSRKDKKEYMKAGEVFKYNMYDDIKNIPTIEELHAMEFEKAKKIAGALRDKFTNAKLQKHWNINASSMYSKVFYKYGIVERQYGSRGGKRQQSQTPKVKDKTTQQVSVEQNQLQELKSRLSELQKENNNLIKENERTKKLLPNDTGLELKLVGGFKGEHIVERMLKYVDTLCPSNNYFIEFKVKEVVEE